MRCVICGMVVAGTEGDETLNAKESAKGLRCGGCFDKMASLLLEEKPDGTPLYTEEQAKAVAAGERSKRGIEEYLSTKVLWLTRNAAGKDARDGVTDLKDFEDANGDTTTVAQMKARAAKALADLTARGGI